MPAVPPPGDTGCAEDAGHGSPRGGRVKALGCDLLVTVCGAVGCALVAYVVHLLDFPKFSLLRFNLWFLPVGALMCGVFAAAAFWGSARLLHIRPTRLVHGTAALVGVAAYFLIHWLDYAAPEVDGVRAPDIVSFGDYLDIVFRGTRMHVEIEGIDVGTTGRLGGWGWLHAVLQVAAFAAPAALFCGPDPRWPYCERCSRYLESAGEIVRYAADPHAVAGLVTAMGSTFADGRTQAAIDVHAAFGETTYRPELLFRTGSRIHRCRRCAEHHVVFSVQVGAGDDARKLEDATKSAIHPGELRVPATTS